MGSKKDPTGETPKSRDYEVGRGKPPLHTRFKKGQSGNPKGRAPGSQNMKTLLDKALDQQVNVRSEGRLKTIAMREAIPRQLVNKAASGDIKAMHLLFAQVPNMEKVTSSNRTAHRCFRWTPAIGARSLASSISAARWTMRHR